MQYTTNIFFLQYNRWVDKMVVWWKTSFVFLVSSTFASNRGVLITNIIMANDKNGANERKYPQHVFLVCCGMGCKRNHRSFIVNIRYIDMYYYSMGRKSNKIA